MYFSFDFGWYSIHLDFFLLRTERMWGVLLNGQNLLSVTKVICGHSLNTLHCSLLSSYIYFFWKILLYLPTTSCCDTMLKKLGAGGSVLEMGYCYFRKKTKRWGWGHGTCRGIEERKCGDSRGVQGKTHAHVDFHRSWAWVLVLFWPWSFQRVSQNFAEFPGVKAFFLQNF